MTLCVDGRMRGGLWFLDGNSVELMAFIRLLDAKTAFSFDFQGTFAFPKKIAAPTIMCVANFRTSNLGRRWKWDLKLQLPAIVRHFILKAFKTDCSMNLPSQENFLPQMSRNFSLFFYGLANHKAKKTLVFSLPYWHINIIQYTTNKRKKPNL